MKKLVEFYYKRDSLPHSEFAVRKSLNKFLEDDTRLLYRMGTSTASVFNLVRAFCLKNKVYLIAYYEDIELDIDENMRMSKWAECPDFTASDDDLDIIMDLANDD